MPSPDGYPQRFRWRGKLREVVRIEDATERRYWIYR